MQMEGLKKKVQLFSTLTAHYIQETASTVIVQCFNVGSVVCTSKMTSN